MECARACENNYPCISWWLSPLVVLGWHLPDLVRLGDFGSYAKGNWGVGSDLDLVAVVKNAAEPFCHRAFGWDLGDLPVPAEILIYTESEWDRVVTRGDRFAKVMTTEVVWLYS